MLLVAWRKGQFLARLLIAQQHAPILLLVSSINVLYLLVDFVVEFDHLETSFHLPQGDLEHFGFQVFLEGP